jgi:outer membrane protein assembly factor BamB
MTQSKNAYVAAFLTLLLLFSFSSLLLSSVSAVPSLNANTLSADSLIEYEWTQFQGDSAFSRSSPSPAPEAPDVLWKTTITGIQSYVTAFNGKIFVTTSKQVIALDKDSGGVVWNTTVNGLGHWPAVYKIDQTHLVVGKACLDIETGTILWESHDFSAGTTDFEAGCYSAEQKMFYTKTNSSVQAWNFSDLDVPPSLVWQTYVPGGGDMGSGVQYGDGKVYPGSLLPHQIALDAKNGSILWDTETKSAMLFSGSYYEGKFLRGGAHDNTYYCFDADSGEVLWTYTADSPDGYWATGSAVAYGLVYATNMDGYIYALDVNTGSVVWKYQSSGGYYFPGYPTVADGKIYVTTSQSAALINGTASPSEFTCFDAFTGEVVWTLPIEAYAPRESVAIAYGNLYLISGAVVRGAMDNYAAPSQVWALGTQSWSMYLKDLQHSGTGQSGPANLTLRWNFTTNGAVTSSPAIVDGKVYVGSQDHYVYSLNARTGTQIWKFKTDGRIESSPAISEGRLFIVSDDGYLYSLNSSFGSLLWKQYVGSDLEANLDSLRQIHSSPVVVGQKVYVGSIDGNLYCINASDGAVHWAFATNGTITSSPAVSFGSVFITSQETYSGVLYQVDADLGTLKWSLNLLYNTHQPSDMSSSPVINGGTLFLSANNQLYVINILSSSISWTYQSQSGFLGSPIYANSNLYIMDSSNLVCLNVQTGSAVWSEVLGAQCFSAPSYADGKLYLASDTRCVYVVDANSGQKLSWFALGSNVWSSPTVYEGRVYVGNQDWNLYCLANYPAIASNMTLTLTSLDVISDELITGAGQLSPYLENAVVTVTLVNPNGVVRNIETSTRTNGTFSFTFVPTVVGNWTVSAFWESDKSFYLSATSEKITFAVNNQPEVTSTPTPNSTETASPTETPIPFERATVFGLPLMYVYMFVVAVLIVVILVSAYVYTKKPPN